MFARIEISSFQASIAGPIPGSRFERRIAVDSSSIWQVRIILSVVYVQYGLFCTDIDVDMEVVLS